MDAQPETRGFPSTPRSVGLLLTYRCTAACANCCFECSPRRTESLPLSTALAVIDQLAGIPGVEGITLSGGECFLRFADLPCILGRARERGLQAKCVTNGYWALDRETARRKLRPLVDAGLRVLELSTDDYHAEHIPLRRAAHALEAAHELGLETHLVVISDRATRGLAEILAGLELSFEPAVAQEFPLLPIGSARDRIPSDRLRAWDHLPRGVCADAVRRPAITPRGEVFACCSVAGFVPPLRIGDVNQPLERIFSRALDDPLFIALSLDGPAKLAEIAARHGLIDLQEPFVGECHLCHALLGNADIAAKLRQELERDQLCYMLRRDYVEAVLARPEGSPSR